MVAAESSDNMLAIEARRITNTLRDPIYGRIKYACEHGEGSVYILIKPYKNELENDYIARVDRTINGLITNGFVVESSWKRCVYEIKYKFAELHISW